MRMPGVEREREHGLLHTYEVCFHSIEKNEHAWKNPILTTTITLQRLKKRGYESLLDVYYELNPSLGARPELVEGNRRVWGGA